MKGKKFMIRKVLCALSLVAISGCSSVNIDNSFPVDCDGVFYTNQGAANELRQSTLHVYRVRIDRFDRMYIKVKSNNSVNLYGGWKRSSFLRDYQCRGEDYGLRGSAI